MLRQTMPKHVAAAVGQAAFFLTCTRAAATPTASPAQTAKGAAAWAVYPFSGVGRTGFGVM
eukprot:2464541-Pyramimonas_sp.AAC.1